VWFSWQGEEGLQGPRAASTCDEEEEGAPGGIHWRRRGTAREVNAGGSSGKKTAALEVLSRKKMAASRHGIFVQAVCATSVDERSLEKLLQAAKSFGRPAMVRQLEVYQRWRVREGGEVWGMYKAKG
jgi:hypothetical protein